MLLDTKKILNELLVDVFNHILDIEQEQLQKNGVELSMNEVHVIEAIHNVPSKTMGNIAEKLRITVGSLTSSMDRLVKKGYVIRQGDSKDRRKVLIALTSLGEEILKIHDDFHNKMIDSLFLDVNIEEELVLIKSLQHLSHYFKIKY